MFITFINLLLTVYYYEVALLTSSKVVARVLNFIVKYNWSRYRVRKFCLWKNVTNK